MEIRRSYDCLISTMGFPTLIRRHLYIESGPRFPMNTKHTWIRDWDIIDLATDLADHVHIKIFIRFT